jgi:hypothetical protein
MSANFTESFDYYAECARSPSHDCATLILFSRFTINYIEKGTLSAGAHFGLSKLRFSIIAEDQVKATLVLLRPAPHRLSRCNKVPIIRILSQKMRRHAAYCQVLPRPWLSVTVTMCRARDDGALLAIDKRDSTSCWRRLQVVPRYTLRIYYPVSILSPIVALRCLTSGVPHRSAIRLISLESAKSFDRGQGWLRQTNHQTK